MTLFIECEVELVGWRLCRDSSRIGRVFRLAYYELLQCIVSCG